MNKSNRIARVLFGIGCTSKEYRIKNHDKLKKQYYGTLDDSDELLLKLLDENLEVSEDTERRFKILMDAIEKERNRSQL